METKTEEKNIYQLFRLSVLIKGIISALEIVAGIVVFFVPVAAVVDIIITFAQNELAESPSSFIAAHILSIAQEAVGVSAIFIGVYLLSRGLIKLVLVWALLNNKLWAYPSSLIVLGLFVLYQLYQIETGHSVIVIAITLFDLVVMYFIWREYRIIDAHRKNEHKKHLN